MKTSGVGWGDNRDSAQPQAGSRFHNPLTSLGHWLRWVVLLSLLAGCSPPAAGVAPTFVPPATRSPLADTAVVAYGDVTETVETRGRVVAVQEALLVFPLGGALKAVHVSPGDQVTSGELLAELDAPEAKELALRAQYDVELARTDLRAAEVRSAQRRKADPAPDVAVAQVELEQAAAELTQAEIEYDEAIHRYWDPPHVTETYSWTLQLKQWNVQKAQARLEQAEQAAAVEQALLDIGVQAARTRLERAEALNVLASEQLSSTLLLAPFSGVIISVEKSPGDWVGAYEAVGALADPSRLWIVATVLEEDIDRVAMDRPVGIRLDAYPDVTYSGTVLQIASQAIIWQGKQAYEVTVAFDPGQDVPATIRMGADVILTGRSRENVLLVPAQSVFTVEGQEYVEVIADDGDVEQIAVETGIATAGYVEVLSGLEAGQVVRLP